MLEFGKPVYIHLLTEVGLYHFIVTKTTREEVWLFHKD